MVAKKVQEEKQHHREAFEMYYLMPQDKRSIRAVARELGKSASTVQSWAKSFDWQERVEIRDGQVQKRFKELQAQNDDTLVNIKASFHKILKALIAEGIDNIKKKRLGIDNVNELLKVMELDMRLLGEDDRKSQSQLNELTEALQASVQMFGQGQVYEYDGNSRIEGEVDDNSGATEDKQK